MDTLDSLLDDIDAAVFDDAHFDPILQSLTQLVGAQTSTLWLLAPPGAAAPPISAVHRIRAEAIPEFAHYWHLLDPWSKQARQRGGMPAGLTAIGSELVDRAEVERSAFYNEWAHEHGMSAMLSSVVAGPADDAGPPRALACFYRGPGQPEFTADDKAALQRVLPRLQAAVRLRDAWRAAARLAGDALQAVEQFDAAAFVLDGQGRIVHANTRALALLQQPCGATRHGGRLAGIGLRTHPALPQAIAAARQSRLAQPLVVQWAGPPPALCRAHVLPLHAARLPAAGFDERLLLIAEQPGGARWLSLAAGFYRLTPAEARVLEQLMAGLDPAAIAERSGLRLTTVRTHIRHLLKKLEVSRAADAVRLLASLRL